MPRKPFLILSCILLLIIAFLPNNALDLKRRKFIENLCLIRAVGVDMTEDGRFLLTVCAPKPSNEESVTIVYTASGSTLAQAEEALQTFAGYDIFWGHLDFLILGESTVQAGITPTVKFFLFKPEISFNLTVYALEQGDAREVLNRPESQRPVFEQLATLSQVTETRKPDSILTILDTATAIYQGKAPRLPFLTFFNSPDEGDYAPEGTLRYTRTASLPLQEPLSRRSSPLSHTVPLQALWLFVPFVAACGVFSARYLKKHRLKKEACLTLLLAAGGTLFTVWGGFHRELTGPIEWLLKLLPLNPA